MPEAELISETYFFLTKMEMFKIYLLNTTVVRNFYSYHWNVLLMISVTTQNNFSYIFLLVSFLNRIA
jgi:hypothetical protein